MIGVAMKRAGTVQGQRRLGLSLRFMLLASLLMLIAVADAAPYVASSFSIMTRGLSQMHSELQTPDQFGALMPDPMLMRLSVSSSRQYSRDSVAMTQTDIRFACSADEAPVRHRLFTSAHLRYY